MSSKWESPHKEVMEARSILRDKFWNETERIANIITNLCDERDELKATLREAQAKAEEKIQSVKNAIEETRERYKNIVKQMSENARKEARANFCQEKMKLKEELQQLRTSIRGMEDDNAMTESINANLNELNVNLNKQLEQFSVQAKEWITANEAYEEENKRLVELNEALAASLEFIEGTHNEETKKLKEFLREKLNENKKLKEQVLSQTTFEGETKLRL